MDFVLFAIGLGYFQAGSNLLQRDLSGAAMSRPLYAVGGPAFPQYAITILLWPVVRLLRRAPDISALRTLTFCGMEWAFTAIISGLFMLAAGLFVEATASQALIVVCLYAASLLVALAADA